MDVLLILLVIGGLVVAGVMVLLASRATRLERDSDARVQELQVLATGSVLFATGAIDEFTPATRAAGPVDEFTPAPLGPGAVAEDASTPLVADPFDEFSDEFNDQATDLRLDTSVEQSTSPAPRPFETPTNAYPFVMTVQTGGGRLVGSFDRAQEGSRT